MADKKQKTGSKLGLFGGSKTADDSLRRLNRMELLELLVEQTKEYEDLEQKLDSVNARNEELTKEIGDYKIELAQCKSELAQCRQELNRVASLEKIMERLEQIMQQKKGY